MLVIGMHKRTCLWCDKDLTLDDLILCFDCDRVSTGMPREAVELLDYLPFGAIEVNRAGEVLAFNESEESLSGLLRTEVIGRNFFTDIAPCANVKDFRGRFESFLQGIQLSERFEYTYNFPDGVEEVRITFLRVNRECALILSKRTKLESA